MTNEPGSQTARCAHCRETISVPDRYAQGDHIKCGTCGTKHKVVRSDRLRLVLADVGPLRDALVQNEQLVSRLEAELARTRASFGLGANGFVIGILYALYQVGVEGAPLSTGLAVRALSLAIVSGLLLEAANWSFLSKRRALTRIGAEVEEARAEGLRIRQQIRDSTRV